MKNQSGSKGTALAFGGYQRQTRAG